MSRPWEVLKYGGTSVAGAANWTRIGDRVRQLLPGQRVWIVVSALAGVSDRLESAIEEALQGRADEAVDEVRSVHRALADELGVPARSLAEVERLLDDLKSWLTGIALTGEAPPRLAARILAVGELASSRLGREVLTLQGLDARWVDARTLLRSEPPVDASDHRRFLEAEVRPGRRPDAAEQAAAGAEVVLTQGFIASTPEDETCLLGRGGSDTSAALFAALLGARELEIWTDVHGLFTADPRQVPMARLIRRIDYREAQELAAMGAKVLHPRCLQPVAQFDVPLSVHCTSDPDRPGTRIEATGEQHPEVTAVTCRSDVTLLSLSTLSMWNESGFLARVFAPFEEVGISVDLVATSQSTVTMTLDRVPGGTGGVPFGRLVRRLERLGELRVVHPCAVVSIVGRRIRAALHELGPAMAVFQERPVHLVADSAEDLNLSFVVDEGDARPLVVRLHERLFATQGGGVRLGPTWDTLEREVRPESPPQSWWHRERERLLELVAGAPDGRYVYHLPTVADRARQLAEGLSSVERVYYSMKANSHPRILEAVASAGLGIECVSAAEVDRARQVLGGETPILFTPNFCPVEEYRAARAAGAEIVVDGPEILTQAPEIFRGAPIGIRVDPGRGRGHHEKVRTAGAQTKFGQTLDEMEAVRDTAAGIGARVVGVHAHVGSGILDARAWAATGRRLATLLEVFPDIEWIDVGGGLGVPERPGQGPLDLIELERGLAELKTNLNGVALRMEPGRFLVSEAGVLLVPVTQVRVKAGVRFVGLASGMNALVRPALYGAWHGIHNLTRIDEPAVGYCHVVGPICETGDVLGHDRRFPETSPGDIVVIENAGAYGAVMASSYNLRECPEEIVLES